MQVIAGVLRAVGVRRTDAVAKTYALDATQIKPGLAPNRGGCLATDDVTVRGLGVGFMYREEGANPLDSGWRFFSGRESQEYLDDPTKSGVYDVNTIANYAPDIIEWLDAPPGAAFERGADGALQRIEEFPFPRNGSEAS